MSSYKEFKLKVEIQLKHKIKHKIKNTHLPPPQKKNKEDLSACWKIKGEFGKKEYAETLQHVNS